ncbi:EamA family transporter RarD [Evansella sp. AB-rgal1]|uniref:EamA family transporter RarD n=1 Tax=Evansella sp. AB-rgal1 TaxID=3242696 RepID=UPI00359DA2B3
MIDSSQKWGTLSGTSAYLLWGTLPIYWKLLEHIVPQEVLAHRIIWSFVFMILIFIVTKRSNHFISECKSIIKKPQLLIGMVLAAALISVNWYTFIWSVSNDQVLQASLGYYINPLVSVLLGVVYLKEKLLRIQWFSVILASIAVIILTVSLGTFPIVAITLAVSFGLYGLIKKVVSVTAMNGVAIEALLVVPIALSFLVYQHGISPTVVYMDDMKTFFLLIVSGAATAVPLILFSIGAKRIPLSLLGFLQYIAPTMMLLLGIFLYNEVFTETHFFSFTLIWVALLVFTLSRIRFNKRNLLRENAVSVTALTESEPLKKVHP